MNKCLQNVATKEHCISRLANEFFNWILKLPFSFFDVIEGLSQLSHSCCLHFIVYALLAFFHKYHKAERLILLQWKTHKCIHTIINCGSVTFENENYFVVVYREKQRLKSQNTWTFLPPRWYETIKSFSNSDVSFGSILLMVNCSMFYSIENPKIEMISVHLCCCFNWQWELWFFFLFWQMILELCVK